MDIFLWIFINDLCICSFWYWYGKSILKKINVGRGIKDWLKVLVLF